MAHILYEIINDYEILIKLVKLCLQKDLVKSGKSKKEVVRNEHKIMFDVLEGRLKRIKKVLGVLENRDSVEPLTIKEEIRKKRLDALALAEATIKEIDNDRK